MALNQWLNTLLSKVTSISNINLALTESKSLRDVKINQIPNGKALDLLNKAKALVMALWKGESVCTTAQIAKFYEVPEDTVRKVITRHRDEFDSDGLKTVSRKDSEFREIMSLNSEGGKIFLSLGY